MREDPDVLLRLDDRALGSLFERMCREDPMLTPYFTDREIAGFVGELIELRSVVRQAAHRRDAAYRAGYEAAQAMAVKACNTAVYVTSDSGRTELIDPAPHHARFIAARPVPEGATDG